MPKFYCEYCGIYLTHSSPSGRNQHNKGRKHQQNRQEYYRQSIEEQKDILEPLSHTQANLQTVLQGGSVPVPSLLGPKPGEGGPLLNMPPGMIAPGGIPPTLQQGGIRNLPMPNQFQQPGAGGAEVPNLLAQLGLPGISKPADQKNNNSSVPPPNPDGGALLPPIPNRK